MKTIVIPGGNSGIGRQAARTLLADGHRLVILGRDPRKGEAALASFGAAAGRASFIAADLSTHDGVRDAARRILDKHENVDALVHTTGVLTMTESRTADGLHPFFAINYLSRYHLTQLLLPTLRRAERPLVLMMTAAVAPSEEADFARFPEFPTFNFNRDRKPVQLGNHHYAAHLTRTEPGLAAGVINAGAVKTDILRAAPWYMRAGAKVLGPIMFDSLETAAHNVVGAARSDTWQSALYWGKPGRFEQRVSITLDTATTQALMDTSRALTGA
ncbi:SDR family NAD(P)-dependent oxidoreductase [Streptomyces sp. HUAS 31]|uniref:SDR family NAD(P)-dependent oxidoreductase n=1 Tax=Streptomyces sp. HUAS 31 TaxID=3020055 RepID=UPI002306927C|nr:SDR family NAD(P)-dependent oxidoreductase [Streptomyces sp. HUAS 31]WCE01878.1 SDR family NAD(P)-dependent oxidoreductase [Streptomyces sp. HUAS 31]